MDIIIKMINREINRTKILDEQTFSCAVILTIIEARGVIEGLTIRWPICADSDTLSADQK